MSDQPEIALQSNPPEPLNPAMANSAIAFCCDAWLRTYTRVFAKDGSNVAARFRAAESYRKALPPLTGEDGIRDFIACIAQGMLIGAIDDKRGTRLLYAAQVAHTAISQPSKRKPEKPE